MNAAVPAICAAADGIWEPPVYMHGGVAWHMPYLGWRGAYAASEFGWHDRAQTHFRAFGDVQLKEPATGQPHADPESNLARQASDSVLYSRGYIPVHPDERRARPVRHAAGLHRPTAVALAVDGRPRVRPRRCGPCWSITCSGRNGVSIRTTTACTRTVANTFISDAHHYSGGACTQASAYNYRAFLHGGPAGQAAGRGSGAVGTGGRQDP